jgi:hypothetical protein
MKNFTAEQVAAIIKAITITGNEDAEAILFTRGDMVSFARYVCKIFAAGQLSTYHDGYISQQTLLSILSQWGEETYNRMH